MLPQKNHFQNFLLKKSGFWNWSFQKIDFNSFLLKLLPQQNTFSRLLPQKIHFQKYFFKNAPSKKTLSETKSSKLLLQKMHFQNCCHVKYDKFIVIKFWSSNMLCTLSVRTTLLHYLPISCMKSAYFFIQMQLP